MVSQPVAPIARLPEEIARQIVDPKSYADWDALHATLVKVRRDMPFARGDLEEYEPFWVASTHADLKEVAFNSEVFLSGNGGNGGMQTREAFKFAKELGAGAIFRSLVGMNAPDHMKYRRLTFAWFQPKNLRPLEERIREIAREFIAQMRAAGGTCDFATDIAAYYPLRVIMSILGVPVEDQPLMLRLTQEFFGGNDKEVNRNREEPSPIEAAKMIRQVADDFTRYFSRVSAERRAQPTDDLATVIANAVIDGVPISDKDAMGYYITVATAGCRCRKRASLSAEALLWATRSGSALAERPAELKKVQADPGLSPRLVEEAIRWTSPIHQFVRTAAKDYVIRGQQVKAGDKVILLYPSANRDESVFDAPFEFRVDRRPNNQIAFSYGPHMCLGMHLARMELTIFFEELLPLIKSLVLAGKPARLESNFNGGPKSVPIRFTLR